MRRSTVAAIAGLALFGVATEARAFQRPSLTAGTGVTMAVDGARDEAGLGLSVAAAWPVAPGWRLGAMAFADDLGARAETLRDPNDGTPLGTIDTDHRMAWGASWRADRTFAAARGWEPSLSATWGWYRLADDRLGRPTGGESSTGVSVGAGVSRVLRGDFAAGASLRWHRLFNDRSRGWLTAGLDWTWR
jgi:hypothetical protein